MPESKTLQLIIQMIQRNSNIQWLYSEMEKAEVTFSDMVLGLKESAEGIFEHEVRRVTLGVVKPTIDQQFAKFPRAKQVGLQTVISRAQSVVADGESDGDLKADLLGQAAYGYMKIANDYHDPEEAYLGAEYLFSKALNSGLRKRTQQYYLTLFFLGGCAYNLVKYDQNPSLRLRQAIRCFIDAREEGLPKWTATWSECLMFQSEAHKALAAYGENPVENRKMESILKARSESERTMPEPITPEQMMA